MSRKLQKNSSRRGMSIVVVLCLIAITLGTSYALMRLEYTGSRIQQNTNRRDLARQAAMIGISVAMRTMQQTGWAGVSTTLTGNVSSQESYQVTYTAGDSTLTSSSPSYTDYPYRVTLDSTGTSADSSLPGLRGTYRIKAVVRLVPRKLVDGPTELASMATHPLYQTDSDTFKMQVPLRIEGPTRIQGNMSWGNYNWSSTQRDRYISDLNLMRLAGQTDQRPFEGPIELAFSQNNAASRTYLTSTCGVTITDSPTSGPSSLWVPPGQISTYRMYPGGPIYTVPSIASDITTATVLAADPIANPAGLFYRGGSATVRSGANVQGTVITSADLTIDSGTTTVAPASLPALYGTTTPIMLPTAIVSGNLTINSGSLTTVNGLLAVFAEFRLPSRPQTSTATIRGCVASRKYKFDDGRTDFSNQGLLTWWNIKYAAFIGQLGGQTHIDYFPQYLNTVWPGSSNPISTPQTKLLRPTTTPTYVWPTNGVAIFLAHPSDGGLRWEMVSWRENQ